MVRPELHRVRRPFFDCTSYKRAEPVASVSPSSDLHLHAEMTRPLPPAPLRYADIKVALRLAA